MGSNRGALAARLLATFAEELREQVMAMNADLLALEADPRDTERLRSVFRSAHTLKGAARAAGVPAVEELCHEVEALLATIRDRGRALGSEDFSFLFGAADRLSAEGERLRLDTAAARAAAEGPAAAVPAAPAAPGGGTAGAPPQRREPVREDSVEPAGGAPEPSAPPAADGSRVSGLVRVEPEKLDAMVGAAGRLMGPAERAFVRAGELGELHAFVTEWSQTWRRAKREVEAALTASSALPSARVAVDRVTQSLARMRDATERLHSAAQEDARTVARVAEDLGDRVTSLRMRPFVDAVRALPRAVRDLAAAAGKEVRLEFDGTEVEADREIWAVVGEALLHLVRNAVDHGIEPPSEREAAGKSPTGLVQIAAAVRGDRVSVTVSDDGAGVDVPALRARLAEHGIDVPDDDRALARLLFQGGLSSRAAATMISGRGVGLDSVRAAVERIRGTVEMTWSAGRGTTFTLQAPVTLTRARAVLVRVGSQILAIPSAFVERMERVRPGLLRHVDGHDVLPREAGPLPLAALGTLIGGGAPSTDGPIPLVVIRVGDRTLGLAVDELLDERLLLIRPLKASHSPPPHLGGAAILGSGRVALVLRCAALVDAAASRAAGPGLGAEAPEAARVRQRRILVVDDSITTRTLVESIIEAAGYEVATAADGHQAWRILEAEGCDLVVSDVEMPRMDGFALCEAIRGSRRLRELPVVLVTALETPEDRARGLEAGADAYLPKSGFDQRHLLDTIRELIG